MKKQNSPVACAAGLWACAAVATQAPAALAAPPDFTPPALAPIVLMEGDRIAACGAEAVFEGHGGRLAISLMMVRGRAGSGERVVRGRWQNPDGTTREVQRVSIAISTRSTDDAAQRWQMPADGSAEARLPATTPSDWTDFGSLMQSLLVGGGEATVATVDGNTVRVIIPGPAPHSVRASYLNCSGDMFASDR